MDHIMEDTSTDFRHEQKYYISHAQATALTERLIKVLEFDKNSMEDGRYLISSVYFDTHYDRSLNAVTDGLLMRKKYRIRSYNHSDDFISLERKSKRGQLCRKESLRIDRKTYDDIMYNGGKKLKELGEPLADEFYNMLKFEGYVPKTIVEYTRRAFVSPISNVRITLDSFIKGSSCGADMFYDCPTLVYTVPPCYVVLEVKYDHFLPDFIRNLLPDEVSMQTSISKYVYGRTFS